MRVHGLAVTASILGVLCPRPTAAAAQPAHQMCPLVLQQQRVDGEERELEVELAESQLSAARSIFDLVDQLWKNEAVERMVYLAAKHERDVAEIEVERQRLLLQRQKAESEQFALVCSHAGDDDAAGLEARLVEARRQYAQADCHRIEKDLAIAEVDLGFRGEVLKSLRDLRESDVGTKQDVIRAERDVEMARIRVERQQQRVDKCLPGLDAAP